MMMTVVILVLAIGLLVGPTVGTLLKDSDIRLIIDEINRLREFSKSSNMAEMTWNYDLADKANAWTGFCSLSTASLPPEIGINKYVGHTMSIDVVRGLSEWACQIKQYVVHAPGCYNTTCGDFSQLVWASTTKVGCAYSECPNITDEDGNITAVNRTLFACLFSPAGNVGEVVAWDSTGYVCSRCPSGAGWCTVYGLCRSNCSGPSEECRCVQSCSDQGEVNSSSCRCKCNPGWYGTDCSNSCEDPTKCNLSSEHHARIHKRQAEQTYLQLCQECLSRGFSRD